MTNVEDMLALTRQALDEFESVPLAASLRRAERIARLRGDIHYAHMFQLDLRPTGGSTTWSRTEAYELLKSEEIGDVDVDVWRSQIFEEWIKERVPSKVPDALSDTFGNGELIGGSIESVIRHSELMERESASRAEAASQVPDGAAPRVRPGDHRAYDPPGLHVSLHGRARPVLHRGQRGHLRAAPPARGILPVEDLTAGARPVHGRLPARPGRRRRKQDPRAHHVPPNP